MRPEFRQYAREMQATFESHLGKDQNHPGDPWRAFPLAWLRKRLMDEFVEWLFVTGHASQFQEYLTKRITDGYRHEGLETGELKDVACFTLFICKAIGNRPETLT